MPNIKIYRARIDIGDRISGLIFSFESISPVDFPSNEQRYRISQIERFYIETPPGYDYVEIEGQLFVRDPQEGENVYMRAARVVSRVWQNDSGFRIIPSTEYASLDRAEST